jgi:hypothetical protein
MNDLDEMEIANELLYALRRIAVALERIAENTNPLPKMPWDDEDDEE